MKIYLLNFRQENKTYTVRGKSLENGLPKSVRIRSTDVKEALFSNFTQMIDGIKELIDISPPEVVVADGHKGMYHFVKRWWPNTAFQRCHFHMVSLVIHYLSRNPKEEAGRDILELMYRLKSVKTFEERDKWKLLHRIWEKQYEKVFAEKNESGGYAHRKLRSVRFIVRKAIPNLFTYLDYTGCPNTTNLVEGWVNTAIAEGLRRHRGLHLSQKKTLVSIILSNLKRPMREKPTRKFP